MGPFVYLFVDLGSMLQYKNWAAKLNIQKPAINYTNF